VMRKLFAMGKADYKKRELKERGVSGNRTAFKMENVPSLRRNGYIQPNKPYILVLFLGIL
jgi:hypothetical protein